MNHPLHQFHYCPRCGSAAFAEHNEKSKKCAECGFIYYFNSSAAVVAVIVNDRGEILVARRAKKPAKGSLDLPGGFIDLYETAEEAVIREIREESGLTVLNPRYLFSIPNIYLYSDFEVHTVDLFFRCKVNNFNGLRAADDVAELLFIPPEGIHPAAFGLTSIRKGIEKILQIVI
ncbi:MAG: Hydrolase, NUDIX family [Proteiniphilum acetatigenes]|uniref:Hydrolase, NUDIX family n=1 Tax=Proteiniphilum acetatigenes TaxID=294710 RepID=A0A101HIN5_9BACT|nr:MAG: Hydrolase, NUDIX family [Proteiniphilum acetatigenes]